MKSLIVRGLSESHTVDKETGTKTMLSEPMFPQHNDAHADPKREI